MTSEKQPTSTHLKAAVKIKVTKNGPYLVYGEIPLQHQEIATDPQGIPIKWLTTAKHPPQETCSLCRCGHSRSKPFCDGTHAKAKFDGTETAYPESYFDKPEEIDGPALKLIDVKELCASARFCHRAGGIWSLIPKSDDLDAMVIAQEEACDCPSGRLIVQNKKSGKIVEPKFEQSIGLVEDPDIGVSGPIWVRGCIPVESADGKTYRIHNRITLCRCGKSSNKPFCDSSHYPDEPQQ